MVDGPEPGANGEDQGTPPPEAPTFVSPSVAPGTAPSFTPGVPLGPPPSPSPAVAAAAMSGERPAPNLSSLIAAVGGVLAVTGLFSLLSAEDLAGERVASMVVSLLFAVLGGVLVAINRSRRAAAGGVVLLALSVIPLVSLVFQSPDDLQLFQDPTSYRNTQLSILVCLAAIWLACYFFGPSRRYGFFLGAALLAMWMVPMTYFSTTATIDALSSFSSPSLSLDPTDLPGFSTDDPFASSSPFESNDDGDNLKLKLGLTSLFFGGAYLAAAGLRDAAGDRRMATPFFAVAPLILFQALSDLGPDLKVLGVSLLGMVLGGVGVWLGARAGRRFTSWIGVASIAFATINLVTDSLDEQAIAIGATLTVLGLILVLTVTWAEGVGQLALFGGDGGGGDGDGDATTAGPSAGPGPAAPSAPDRQPPPEAWAPPATAPHPPIGQPNVPPAPPTAPGPPG